MEEFKIVPEFRHYKAFPMLAITHQLISAGFLLFGHFVTSLGFILAFVFELCVVYYLGLYVCNRCYRLNITSSSVTIWSIFSNPQIYRTETLRWRIRRIPWYNLYYIFLYSSGSIPISIVQPHWKNALRIIHFPHFGKITSYEYEYLKFLRSIGLLQ